LVGRESVPGGVSDTDGSGSHLSGQDARLRSVLQPTLPGSGSTDHHAISRYLAWDHESWIYTTAFFQDPRLLRSEECSAGLLSVSLEIIPRYTPGESPQACPVAAQRV
jgi:hypothetical protein